VKLRTPPAPAPPSALDLAVDLLAAYRLTRLATADVVSESIRQAVVRRVGVAEPGPDEAIGSTAQDLVAADPEPPKLATLVTCRWCAGMWIAGGVGAARSLAPRAWSPVAWSLALSAGAALIARLEDG
jgi:hypothetical protein